MFKSALTIAMLAFTAAAMSAQDKFDCGIAYKRSLEGLRHKKLSPERLAVLTRWASRIYDACETKDLTHAKSLFENLDRWKD
jgi:hypothetical protein